MGLTVGRLVLLACLTALAGLVLFVHRSDAARNARYGEIASEIAGREVEVRCPGFWTKLVTAAPNEGTVGVSPGGVVDDHTDLSVEICAALDSVVAGAAEPALACLAGPAGTCGQETADIAFAIEALAHESHHLRGVLDEARTECYAMQTSAATAVRLGLSPAQAQALGTYYRERLYLKLPAEYHSNECRPGGAYDLHPETAAWPDG